MKITIERSVFLKALSHGQSVVERKTTIPILSHVLLTAIPTSLTLTTTDMDLALIETVPATVINSGTATVSAQMLFEIVRKLPEASTIDLTLLPETGQLNLKCGRSRFNLPSLPAEDFPQLTQGELPYRFTLPAFVLRKLLDRTKFAMSAEETRYYLNGIYLHAIDQGDVKILRAVATDAHRLAFMDTPLPQGAEDMPGIIIGRKTVVQVMRLIDDAAAEVTLSLSAARIEFAFPSAVLSSRLIDAIYPEYEKAIPLENDKRVIINAKVFASAVDRVATVTNDKVRAIKLSVSANTLALSATGQDLGNAVEEIVVDFPHETAIEIGFNAWYLFDIAQQINEDEAQVILAHAEAPAIIKGVTDQDATFILMPMRV